MSQQQHSAQQSKQLQYVESFINNNQNDELLQNLPDDIRDQVTKFDTQLRDLDAFIRPLFQFQNLAQLTQDMEPLERAKLNMCLAYTANTLFYMFLKTQGINPQKHPVKKEIQRIQQYMAKIKAKQQQIQEKRSMSLNKDAASRFINAALSSNDSRNKKENDVSENEENHVPDAGDDGMDMSDDEVAEKSKENIDPSKKSRKNSKKKRKRSGVSEESSAPPAAAPAATATSTDTSVAETGTKKSKKNKKSKDETRKKKRKSGGGTK